MKTWDLRAGELIGGRGGGHELGILVEAVRGGAG